LLLEGGKRVLPSFSESLARKAAARLPKLGVKVVTGAMVEHIDERGVTVGGKRIESGTVLWTAGVAPSPLVKMLGVATDRAGRASVSPQLNLPDNRRVFVVGDTATLLQDGKPLPGVAQVAIQQGRYVGRLITQEISGGKPPRPFRYFDKGNMAVVGKNFAVMESGRNSDRDREDVLRLAQAGHIDSDILKARYPQEVRPYLLNKEEWHDQTLELWMQMIAAPDSRSSRVPI